MPEEINRILTDQLSELLFTTERTALANLVAEGISEQKVHFVGNVMIDTLRHNLEKATPASETLPEGVSADGEGFGLLTMHRPSNVDDPAVLERLCRVLAEISESLPLVFPIHPRTQKRLVDTGLEKLLQGGRIHTIPPQGYLEMLGLMKDARLVLTDSGGIQEETTALGVPCITLRENTERPITITEGTNTLAGTSAEKILASFREILQTGGKAGRIPECWDGKAAERIVAVLDEWPMPQAANNGAVG